MRLLLLLIGFLAVATTSAKEADPVARVAAMEFWRYCREVGRVVRGPVDKRELPFEKAVLARATAFNIARSDWLAIREKRLRVGLSECAVAAILGQPDDINRTNNARGRHDQWVYRQRGMYIYTENSVMTSWQE